MAFLRSYLFVPGSREDLLRKVFDAGADAGADAVVLDLEDAVPHEQKAQARALVAALVDQRINRPGSPLLFIRVNAAASGMCEADLSAAVRRGVAGIRLPKVERDTDVQHVDRLIGGLESERGLEHGAIELTLTLESARGIEYATPLAMASRRIRNLCFGAADFVANVGAQPSSSENETLYARSRMVISSRIAELDPPIAAAYTRLDDDYGLRESCEAARLLGFFGRSCLHPRQVPIVTAAFTPRPDDLARAQQIVDAFARAARAGLGAARTTEGAFVDPATFRQAQGLLALATRFQGGKTA